ncbi:hypothetical protein Celaphus_00016234 [Cervus elaphus hippelaphus]|uniref:DUF4503 domain-containing protein n=1 Tax=Cervus elaphus hippelaphus TaxID=46360 RepID=A0A212CEL2_CEREH|nr:hypothetical protein Celaphus_00016234 [Cervus elaphus hippelaphus]
MYLKSWLPEKGLELYHSYLQPGSKMHRAAGQEHADSGVPQCLIAVCIGVQGCLTAVFIGVPQCLIAVCIGTVVAVDESTACSWPVCDLCGSERLGRSPADSRGAFSCGDCSRVVTSPVLRRHLQVFLDTPSQPQCTVRVKLLQDSISSLLRFAACEDGSYEVRSVLGKEVGPLTCFVRCITTHPTCSVGLEEVELLSEGRAS